MEPRWAVFISGRGSNLQSLIDLCDDRIRVVVTNRKKSLGVLRARRAGIPVFHFSKETSWAELIFFLKKHQIQSIFLLGFMKIVPAEFVEGFRGKILNLHPSLLPAFPGLRAIENSYESGNSMGVTIHVVTEEMDAGPIVLQKTAVSREKRESLTLEQAEFLIATTEQFLVNRVFAKVKGL